MGWENMEIIPSGVSILSMSCVQGKGFVPLCTSIIYTLRNTGYLYAKCHPPPTLSLSSNNCISDSISWLPSRTSSRLETYPDPKITLLAQALAFCLDISRVFFSHIALLFQLPKFVWCSENELYLQYPPDIVESFPACWNLLLLILVTKILFPDRQGWTLLCSLDILGRLMTVPLRTHPQHGSVLQSQCSLFLQ